ncbi:MAG: polyphosphate kinase 1, partial [Candidatus Omnitrophica bacterium]|nr:polyphosphate kinase 1 [Candidatus Omnitrophota bacterium]
MEEQHRLWSDVLIAELQSCNIRRVRSESLTHKQHEMVKNLFYKEWLSLLTPIALHANKPLPTLLNLNLYMLVELVKLTVPSEKHYAVVAIPGNLPRIIWLPSEAGSEFILIEDVMAMFIKELFRGYEITEHGLMRLTRTAEMTVDEENDEDFADVMTDALRSRYKNQPVRLEISAKPHCVEYAAANFKVKPHMIFKTSEWVDLKSVAAMAFQPQFSHLARPAWKPKQHPELGEGADFWDALKERDIMLHYPYESFDTFNHFLAAAADDPNVLAIKQTLYRTAKNSLVVKSLKKAALSGKQVTVLVELKARFDEEANIEWAHQLENAGATVLYGIAGLKTHAKACMVIRRETEGVRRYVHLGTGNYNEKTAVLYTDHSFFTSNETIANDVTAFFNVISGYSDPVGFSAIEMAPYRLRKTIQRMIEREIMAGQNNQPGLIIAKMNSLVDQAVIQDLYRASQAGVQILLNIRGVCCLKPGIPGLSENIRVVSVVDMFLEHSRMFYFQNAGDEELYLSSADWMPRNFDRRIEIIFPVKDPVLKKKLTEVLKLYFKDNANAWSLSGTGEYTRAVTENKKRFRIQEYLCVKAEEAFVKSQEAFNRELKPQRPVKS